MKTIHQQNPQLPAPSARQALAMLLGWLAFAVPAQALEYTLDPPSAEVTADLVVQFSVTSDEPIRLEPAPAHPRIGWLPTTVEVGGMDSSAPGSGGLLGLFREKKAANPLPTGKYRATFRFVPNGAGAITPPPIPVMLGKRRILLRLPKLTVRPNPQPAGATKMITVWNGKPRQPRLLRAGQTIDLEILGVIPASVYPNKQNLPSLVLESARWFKDFARNPNETNDHRFISFGSRMYERLETTFRGRKCRIQRYRTRFTVVPGDRLQGMVGLTLSDGKSERTHHESVDLPISPLPPVPVGSHTPTGLFGEWSFVCTSDLAEPAADRPITISLDIDGRGDSTPLRDLDFSRPGFRSVGSKLEPLDGSNFDHYRARFTQTLVADGTASVFPAISLLSFDTPSDAWKVHPVTGTLRFPGLGDALADISPGRQLGRGIQRPILLNLHPATFAALGFAPLLPLLAGIFVRRRKMRDPASEKRRKKFRQLRRQLETTGNNGVPELLENDCLPLLRSYCRLPDGASTREVADAIDAEHPELGQLLRDHANADFTNASSPTTCKSLAPLLARLSFALTFFLVFTPANARAETARETLDTAAADFAEARYESAAAHYQQLIIGHPGHPELHLDLARTRLAANQLHLARASAYTAFLLDPLNQDARRLLDTIHRRLGDPPLPGSSALALRPDQLLSLAAAAWVLAFLLLGLRRLTTVFPRWPAAVCFGIVLGFLTAALWRNTHAYAPDQFMVIAPELPREAEPGTPDFDLSPLRSGTLVRGTTINQKGTHLHIATSGTAFWLPVAHLQKIW